VRRWIEIAVVGLVIASGCDKPAARVALAPVPSPATAPSTQMTVIPSPATAPAVEAADTTPASCMMMIDQRPVEFPPAMLRIQQVHGQVVALLYSNDPKEALNDNYQGNGFYFQLQFDVPSPQFNQAIWIHRAQTSQRVDTPYGIFLYGHRRQLQPLDVRIRLLPSATGDVKVEMSGTFLSVDPQDELATTQVVPVAAWLVAETK
jgi:hypothetical protein